MPKTDNPHAIRLYDSIRMHADEKTAGRIAHKIPLSKSADFEKKFAWAESVCADLEQEFDDSAVRRIRMDCACGPEIGKMEKLRKLYRAAVDMDDFVTKANRLNQGFTMEHTDNGLFLIYPQCYCSCVKRVEKPITKTWCYCTLGYTKRMFEYVLDKTVMVELIESVKTGGSACRIKIV